MIVVVTGALLVITGLLYYLGESAPQGTTVQVLSYSGFLNAWGPGPEIAKLFRDQTGINVEYRDAGDAGLILRELDLFRSDAVVGLDQLSLPQARLARDWRPLDVTPDEASEYHDTDFLAFDYAPLDFVYRKGEIAPPTDFSDLLDDRFRGSIALEDPRESTPGLQFFFWILDQRGEEAGFEYLKKLKPNIKAVAHSWSTAYGLFTKKQARLVCSYVTSPLYHLINEKDDRYAAAPFQDPVPLQIEYVGVPAGCTNCEAGEAFAHFLLKPEIQSLIMQKNDMLPVVRSVANGTPFAAEIIPTQEYKWHDLPGLLQKRDQLLRRWSELNL